VTSWRCPDEVGDCHTSQAAWWLRFQDEHRAHKGKPHGQCRAKTRALRRLQGSLRLAIGGRGDEYLDNSRYRGSAAAGGGAIIAGPWSEFQRPRELPLSRVRSGRRPGDYRGSVERISASARAVAIAGPQRPAAGRLSRVRGAYFSVRESCRYRGSAAAGGGAIIAGPWSEFQRPRELPLSRIRQRGHAACYHGSAERISASVAGLLRIRSTVVNGLAQAVESPPGPLLRASGRSGGPLHVGERGGGGAEIPCSLQKIPCSAKKIPCSVS
jgi:hypothetical protein